MSELSELERAALDAMAAWARKDDELTLILFGQKDARFRQIEGECFFAQHDALAAAHRLARAAQGRTA